MKKILIFIVSFISFWFSVVGQQNDDLKFNFENQFINNPAAISSFNELRISSYYLRQFSQVKNAPTDIFISFQSPIPYQRAMVGAALITESAGLIRNTRINVAGAYKIPRLLNNRDYLSTGLSFTMNQLGVNVDKIKLTQAGDPLSNLGSSKAIGFNVGVGAFYSSATEIDFRRGRIEYQIGLSSTKSIPQSINFSSFSIKESLLFNGFGALFIPVQGVLINPYAEVQMENKFLTNVNVGLRSVLNSSFILGISLDNDIAIGFQAGYKIQDVLYGGSLQILAQSVIPTGTIDKYINPGYGLSVHYIFDMTNLL